MNDRFTLDFNRERREGHRRVPARGPMGRSGPD